MYWRIIIIINLQSIVNWNLCHDGSQCNDDDNNVSQIFVYLLFPKNCENLNNFLTQIKSIEYRCMHETGNCVDGVSSIVCLIDCSVADFKCDIHRDVVMNQCVINAKSVVHLDVVCQSQAVNAPILHHRRLS